MTDPLSTTDPFLARHPTLRTLLVLQGLPASGKSSFARKLLDKEPDRWRRINKDDLRTMGLGGKWSKSREHWIRQASNRLVRLALSKGFDVILDNTHLTEYALKEVHELAAGEGAIRLVRKAFNVPVAVCQERNAMREGLARVPRGVIDSMARKAGITHGRLLTDEVTIYPPAAPVDAPVYDPALPDAIICDLDGTLAHMGQRSPYDASRCDELDRPNEAVVQTVLALHATGKAVLFMSGRSDEFRAPTERFIRATLQGTCLDARDSAGKLAPWLQMRRAGDQRKDAVVKRELYLEHVHGKFNVLCVLDDRNQVVDEWRRLGLTCFQVAPGDF